MAAERFDWVHTVSSEKIANRLSEQRPAGLAPLNVLIQVNVSSEATKAGVSLQEALSLAQKISSFKGIRLRGLMAVPEPTDDTGLQRSRFSQVRKLFEELKNHGLALDTLSMGMSDDMESAIAEGATLVRIGTAIFGKRSVGARTTEKSAA
jgi:pyridoxal phosphate enzyme (YggS family)